MDAVITYVNCDDPIWRQSYKENVCDCSFDITKYRDWGTLKYIFRGIELYMPFVDRIILVVSGESQVPDFVNRDTVKIVKHEEFIPPEFLPTFNANTIEVFMPCIEGLSEKYLFFNDDFFVMQPCLEEDFFVDDKPNIWLRTDTDYSHGFFKMCSNSTNMANFIAFGYKARFKGVLMPQHTIAPFIRSKCLECLKNGNKLIMQTISKTRDEKNVTQYLYSDYAYLTKYYNKKEIDYSLLRFLKGNTEKIVNEIETSPHKTICINEKKSNAETSGNESDMFDILCAFERKFPSMSRFEK